MGATDKWKLVGWVSLKILKLYQRIMWFKIWYKKSETFIQLETAVNEKCYGSDDPTTRDYDKIIEFCFGEKIQILRKTKETNFAEQSDSRLQILK